MKEFTQAKTQEELTAAINRSHLSPAAWKALCRKLTGRTAKSSSDARNSVHTHLSDNLLLEARIRQVKKIFRG
jgi:hypothetical protein